MSERLGSLQSLKKDNSIASRRSDTGLFKRPCTILEIYDGDSLENVQDEELKELIEKYPGRVYAKIDVKGKVLYTLLDATLTEYNLQYSYLDNYIPYYVIKNNDVASGVLKLYNKAAEPAKLNEKIITYDIGDIL